MLTLLLVRHAEAEGNSEGRFIGQADVPLTDGGRAQVGRLTERLVRWPITRIVSSDLQRCRDTVGPTARRLGIEMTTDEDLREIANGDWGGRLAEEIEAEWPDLFARYRGGEDVPRPGGERWADVSRRVTRTLERIAAAADTGETVLVGTHAGPTLAAMRWAAGMPVDGNVFRGPFTGVVNTAISTIAFPGPQVAGFNDAAHLEA
ncbi:MAG TPA: histidine phosphatase family protein [Acidimicrobiia bacterium]|nr:histidine phosphatase family protein [Acidimicrobiia bacterium]